MIAERPPAGLRHAVGGEHLLGHRLVHRQRRAEHAGADVGDVGELEEALHRAVLAHRAVEQGQDDGRLGGYDLERRLAATTDGPVGSSFAGSAAGPASSACAAPSASAHSPSVEMPIGVTR